jgi:CheY-like chemotaxis protein
MTSSILLQEPSNNSIFEDLKGIQHCAERGAEMVRQLLIFARGSDGRRVRVGLRSIAADTHKMVRETFPKNISVELSAAEGLWDVQADTTQMHQLLTNLCVNARDAMPDGGHLIIGLENTVLDEVYTGMNLEAHPGPYLLVRVEDTGEGMHPDVLDRIFEPFYTTKEVGKGTGLGLSTVHAIVRGHRGFIHVYSELGKGSKFKIYLPAAQAISDDERAKAEQYPLPRGQGELILVVDDEELIRNVARRMLERYGYRVVTAPNGAEAVAIYAQMPGQIALVLTDMSMPVMDGPSTIVALRSIDPTVRIIGSSGLNANGNVAKAMDAGVQVFVPKPYTAEAMLRTIRRVLGD